jgi:glucose/arabinose dehydrogenase
MELVTDGLAAPTQLAQTPDGRIFVTQQTGEVRVVEDGVLLDEPFVVVDAVAPPGDYREHGLAGIAVDPEFESNGYVYVYFERAEPHNTVLARLTDEDGRGTDLTVLLTLPPPAECCHLGGGMVFAPDGTLFIGIGDHDHPRFAQDRESKLGAILHLNRDGTPAAGNPFGNEVYAYGFRNPYDVAIDPATGRLFAGENGFFGQDAVIDVEKGANYGWPGQDLSVPREQIAQPFTFYPLLGGIAGMEFYSGDALPELRSKLFYCRFIGNTLHQIDFNPDGSFRSEQVVGGHCTNEVAMGADGLLYTLDYGEGALYRIVRE